MKISEMPTAGALTGSEIFEIVQDGVSRKCSITEIMAAAPDANGVYPDVPLNRVTLKRFSGQASTIPAICDNLGMIQEIQATAYPVLLDRNSLIVAYLNGNDMRKTADGLPSVLNDWTLQAMVRMGGIYYKYYYVASTNEKVFHFSTKKVRGYKYIRRRFLSCFNGTVETQESKQVLLSNAEKWSTQSYSLTQYHAFAKNLGEHYREIATQDREVFRLYFWLIEKTFNSQSVFEGISNVGSDWWSKFTQVENGGQSSYAQFHKNGATLDIAGHKGEKTISVSNSAGVAVNVKPCKWLWRENPLSGAFWIWETGYLKKDSVWYRCKDLSKIAFTVTADYEALCDDCGAGTGGGYILENFADTLIPQQIGGSTTTGMCDHFWRAATPGVGTVYIPAGVGGARDGSSLGVSCLTSSHVASTSNAVCGGALASDDPTDRTANGTVVA